MRSWLGVERCIEVTIVTVHRPMWIFFIQHHVILYHLRNTRSGPNSVLRFVGEPFDRVVIYIEAFVEVKIGISQFQVQFDLILANGFQVLTLLVKDIVPTTFFPHGCVISGPDRAKLLLEARGL